MTGAHRSTGRVVPAYAFTAGRTRSATADLPIASLVTATDRGRGADDRMQLEYRAILSAAVRPVSLWEVAAHLDVPVGVARVLVGDLAEDGYLTVHAPPPTDDGSPAPELLSRLLEGLRGR
jgi:Protein of unknown function (DUF742)